MKQTINIHIDKLVDKIEINNPNEIGSQHDKIEKVIFDALTEAIFSPELKNTEAKSSLSARQNNIERAFNSVRYSNENRALATQKDYSKLTGLMTELIDTAQYVISEAHKEVPNHVKICDLGIEKIDELREHIFTAITGSSTVIR